MLEKNSKITVLRKMIGLGEEIEPQYIVPHNSILNIRQKMGLTEQPAVSKSTNKNAPNNQESGTMKCPHCENMAKNFLYLESLIRSNYSPKYECSLCQSSLKYLQYVNRSIMQVFGNFDSIMTAAQAFAVPRKRKFSTNTSFARIGAATARATAGAEKSSLERANDRGSITDRRSLSKHSKKSKKPKTSKQMSSKADLTRSSDDMKQEKTRAKTQLKTVKSPTTRPYKIPTPNRCSPHNLLPKRGLQVTYVRNGRYPTSKKPTTMARTNILMRPMKQKNIKPKRNKPKRLKTNNA